jgi:hypothetical protein
LELIPLRGNDLRDGESVPAEGVVDGVVAGDTVGVSGRKVKKVNPFETRD